MAVPCVAKIQIPYSVSFFAIKMTENVCPYFHTNKAFPLSGNGITAGFCAWSKARETSVQFHHFTRRFHSGPKREFCTGKTLNGKTGALTLNKEVQFGCNPGLSVSYPHEHVQPTSLMDRQ